MESFRQIVAELYKRHVCALAVNTYGISPVFPVSIPRSDFFQVVRECSLELLVKVTSVLSADYCKLFNLVAFYCWLRVVCIG